MKKGLAESQPFFFYALVAGFYLMIVASRSGPSEIILIGTPR